MSNKFPPGWDEERVRQVLAHYEQQTEEEAVAEDEAAFEQVGGKMKDPAKMTKTEKYNYIFAPNPNRNNEVRFDWIYSCLLGDIQTFLDGVENFIQNKRKFFDNLPRGGGNLSVPILVSTGLEFVSALYVGKTAYKDGKKYNATENVKEFIVRFFPNI